MLTHRKARRVTRLFLLFFVLAHLVVAQRGPTPKRPRLVLLIVVDQFRYDYLQRFQDLFGAGGLRRLMHDGAFWVDANYPYVPTKTAPGHTAMMTGAPPSTSGIVANEWIDREALRKVTSVEDRSVKLLGGGPRETPNSPKNLLASTVGDELRQATKNRAKVFGISDKARSAILPAGRRANAAYWLSSSSGNVITSDYYFRQLPEWVNEFNQTRPLDKYFGARWDRLLAESEYLKHAGQDSPPWENIDRAPGFTNAFPHWINGGARQPGTAFYDALDHSPFVNDVLVAFTEKAIEKEHLGDDEITDVLTVSLSGNDHVGHRFGPYSQEVMDVTLRVDKQIASLLDFVDARVGLKNTLVIFSSDHGVAPLLDWSATQGVSPIRIGNKEILDAVHGAIRNQLRTPENTNDYVLQYKEGQAMKDAILNGSVYFDLQSLERDKVDLDRVLNVAATAVRKVRGVARVFTRTQLEYCLKKGRDCRSLQDPVGSRVLRGFDPKLTGDLIVIPKPYIYLGEGGDPANHGSPYPYDTHVPLIIMGGNFKPGHYRQPATPLDIAPTLSSVLGIPRPDKSQGRILREAITH